MINTAEIVVTSCKPGITTAVDAEQKSRSKMRNKFQISAIVALSTAIAVCTNGATASISEETNREEKISFSRNRNQASDNDKGNQQSQGLKQDINSSSVKIISSVDGSGVIVKKEKSAYEILTAWHVLKNTTKNEKVKITTFDGREHEGLFKSINRIGASDLATINFISKEKYRAAELLETEFKREMQVVIAGYPNGSDSMYFDDGKITFSSVEAIADGHQNQFMDQGYQLIYTSKTMIGISGGGIFSTQGQLIGIHGRGELDRQVTTREKKITKSAVNYGMPINIYLDPITNATSTRLRKVIPSTEEYSLEAVNIVPIHRGNERIVIATMDEIISREKYFPAYLFKSKALEQIGDLQGTIQVLSEGLSIKNLTTREKVIGLTHRAGAHAKSANFEEAINDLNKIISLASEPSYSSYREQTIGDEVVGSKLSIINYLKKLKRTKEVQKHIKDLEEYRRNHELKPWTKYRIDNKLAYEKYFEGKLEESLELFFQALSHIESENLQIGGIIDPGERELFKDKEYARKTLNYDLFEDQRKSALLFIAEFIYPKIGKSNKSLEIVNKYIKDDPFDLEALETRADLLSRNGEYTKAEKDALKILDIEPRHNGALLTLSYIYRFRDNDMQRSCQYYARHVLEQGSASFHSNTTHHKDCQTLGFVD
ncbi:serine protease [Synechococcus sp. AH-551-E02]|nr:serine protease [Synechococcus sp. AH-551-E02]MDB4653634.1 serine protease [Synechococcus sp. AH-551-E02]